MWQALEDFLNRRRVMLAWISVLAGSLIAALTLYWDGRHMLPADAVAIVGEHSIARTQWLKAVQAVEQSRREPLDEAGRRAILQRLIDEELLLQHALDSGFARDNPGLRKTLVAALMDAATAQAAVADEAAVRRLFETDPGYFSAQPRLRVRAVRTSVGEVAPDRALLKQALLNDLLPAGIRRVDLPSTPLSSAQIAQHLGGAAAGALQDGQAEKLLGPYPSGDVEIFVMLLERVAQAPRFEDVQDAVRSELERRNAERALEQLLAGLRRDKDVRIAENL